MAEKPGSTRRYRTIFSPEQLRILKDTFEKTMYPHWVTMMALTSATHLDELVIKTWFKNQRIKRRKQQLQTQPRLSLEAPGQINSVKEEENALPVTSTNICPMSPSISDANDHEPPKPSGIEQPGGAGASVWNATPDSLPHDLQQICLGVSDPPWASIPYDIDQFVQLYALAGDDHPSSLDQYLLPGGGGMAGNNLQCDG